MMNFLRITLICILLQMLMVLITSCCKGDFSYVWTDIFLTNIDNRGENPIEAEDSELPAIAYVIGVQVEAEPTYVTSPQFDFFLSDFAATAYASTCDYTLVRIDTILDIRIYTLSDFDTTHPSGSELTDYFVAKNQEPVGSSSKENKLALAEVIPTFIEQVNTAVEDGYFNNFDLFLLKSPEAAASFQFAVEIEMLHEGILRDTTESIVLY